jgi:hypothetical protein
MYLIINTYCMGKYLIKRITYTYNILLYTSITSFIGTIFFDSVYSPGLNETIPYNIHLRFLLGRLIPFPVDCK